MRLKSLVDAVADYVATVRWVARDMTKAVVWRGAKAVSRGVGNARQRLSNSKR